MLPESANEDTLNFRQQSFGSLAEKQNRQLAYYKSENIKTVLVWECEWISKNPDANKIKSPESSRLIPREALRLF